LLQGAICSQGIVVRCFGAIDCKVTSDSLAPTHEAWIVVGPTYENLPYFSWADWPQDGVDGLETVYDFDWVLINPSSNFSAWSGVDSVVGKIEELVDGLIAW